MYELCFLNSCVVLFYLCAKVTGLRCYLTKTPNNMQQGVQTDATCFGVAGQQCYIRLQGPLGYMTLIMG